MLFHEIYGCYFEAVGKIIECAIDSSLTKEKMYDIIEENTFLESILTIFPALNNEEWSIINKELKTPIQHLPKPVITHLEKQWLKAISLDPKIKLFQLDFEFLDDIEPLFTPDDFYIFDQMHDGDPFEDPQYIQIFQTLLKAIHQKKKVNIHYYSKKKKDIIVDCSPIQLQYSLKDNKFRLFVTETKSATTFNLSNIKECTMLDKDIKIFERQRKIRKVILELKDERNALERAMLHFSHYAKETIQLDEDHYLIKIYYDVADEIELVIRVLSFGPFVKVKEPELFISLIKQRLKKQASCE